MRSRWVPGQQPLGQQGLLHLAARRQGADHLAEGLAVRARTEDQGDAAHGVSARGSGARGGDRGRAQAQMPGLPFVDRVDLARLLALPQQPFQDPGRAEPAEPGHLDVHGVPGAVRAGQRGRVAERAQPALLLDAPGQAGDPQRGCSRRGRRRSRAASWLSRVSASRRARAKRRPAVRGVRSGRSRRSAARTARTGERPCLAAVAEMQFPGAAQRLEIDELGRVEQIRIRHESPGGSPPHDVDQGGQVNPDMGHQIGCAIAGAGLVMADLTEQPAGGRGAAFGAGRQYGGELRLGQPLGQYLFRLDEIGRSGMGGDLDEQIGDGVPVPGQVRSGIGRGSVSVH